MIETAMRSYEREFKELDIHLIDEVLDLIAFQERVLSKPGGCLLLALELEENKLACSLPTS